MSTDNQPTILIKYGVFLYVVTYARWVSYYVLYVLFLYRFEYKSWLCPDSVFLHVNLDYIKNIHISTVKTQET